MERETDVGVPGPGAPGRRISGPMAGKPGADRFYAARLRQLLHADFDEAQAAELWQSVTRHRRRLERELGRDVGQRVALLDYVVNIRRQMVEPTIIDSPTFAAIERQAVADALTGLYNRSYFDTTLARETERCLRYGATVSLLMFDLDGFKAVNDTHGHRVGDEVLRAVGARVLDHLRAADVPCRYGGDELAVIFPDTPERDALVVGGRICRDVRRYFRRHRIAGKRLDVTVSGGVASVTGGMRTADELIAAADRALYDAKQQGGNRMQRPG